MLSRREVSLSIFEEIYGQVTIEQGSKLDMSLDKKGPGEPTGFPWNGWYWNGGFAGPPV
jgi:hypothetical protein